MTNILLFRFYFAFYQAKEAYLPQMLRIKPWRDADEPFDVKSAKSGCGNTHAKIGRTSPGRFGG